MHDNVNEEDGESKRGKRGVLRLADRGYISRGNRRKERRNAKAKPNPKTRPVSQRKTQRRATNSQFGLEVHQVPTLLLLVLLLLPLSRRRSSERVVDAGVLTRSWDSQGSDVPEGVKTVLPGDEQGRKVGGGVSSSLRENERTNETQNSPSVRQQRGQSRILSVALRRPLLSRW